MASIWLQQVGLLSPDGETAAGDALFAGDGELLAIGAAAATAARELGLRPVDAANWWLGPALVDPHSVLEDPWGGRAETLASLAAAALAGGYGSLALLPWAASWRDRPERLQLVGPDPLRLLLWGSFSVDGADQRLAPHGDQLAAGALGLAGGENCPPLALLERGLSLAEQAEAPLLLAPRDASLVGAGFVREGVEALRAGWPMDPSLSEQLPLQTLLSLAEALRVPALRLMNISTAAGVELLRGWRGQRRPLASVCWWHLLADAARLDPTAEGWRLVPSLGTPRDREALIGALGEGLISAVAVNHLALDAEEHLLPLDQRRSGVAGHGLVLPLLWRELVAERGWSPAQLWQVLCWGPAQLLAIEPPLLRPGTRHWLLFDPQAAAAPPPAKGSLAANRPLLEQLRPGVPLRGAIRASGLVTIESWDL
jgi:dihydroorotase